MIITGQLYFDEECTYENFESLTILFEWMDAHIYEKKKYGSAIFL